MINHKTTENLLEALVGFRFTKKELKERLEKILGLELDEMDSHYVDGKKESNVDDFFSFELESETGDIYLDVYFLKTNERGILYITEVAYDFYDWKEEEKDYDDWNEENDYSMGLAESMQEAEEENK